MAKFIRFITFFLGYVWGSGLGLDFSEARHLLYRTGFSTDVEEIERWMPLNRREAARKIVSESSGSVKYPHATQMKRETLRLVRKQRENRNSLTEAERNKFSMEKRKIYKKQLKDLQKWWFKQMIDTRAPLVEKMVLFWHNHFATSVKKVQIPYLMYLQHRTLRKHALGNFRHLLQDIAKDPAMMKYLDIDKSRKGKPNENFAREVMELFTLGEEGPYTEQDVREASRAFTGWRYYLRNDTVRFRENQYDDGVKIILGARGHWTGDDVINLLLEKRECAQFIVSKLWQAFISPKPDPDLVKEWASHFYDGYDIRRLLILMLSSDCFYAEDVRGTLIKSPVELLVGTVRQFRLHQIDDMIDSLPNFASQLGQDIFAPPNVKGWPGGAVWINSQTLLLRNNFTSRLFLSQQIPSDNRMMKAKKPRQRKKGRKRQVYTYLVSAWMNRLSKTPEEQKKIAASLLLPLDATEELPWEGSDEAFLDAVIHDPIYQLN